MTNQLVGWSEEQRRRRLPLAANNARLLVLPECHYPNLVSRFMKIMLADIRRLTVSLAQHWLDQCRADKRRGTVRGFLKRFHHHQTGPQRLSDLIFAKQPAAWACVD